MYNYSILISDAEQNEGGMEFFDNQNGGNNFNLEFSEVPPPPDTYNAQQNEDGFTGTMLTIMLLAAAVIIVMIITFVIAFLFRTPKRTAPVKRSKTPAKKAPEYAEEYAGDVSAAPAGADSPAAAPVKNPQEKENNNAKVNFDEVIQLGTPDSIQKCIENFLEITKDI